MAKPKITEYREAHLAMLDKHLDAMNRHVERRLKAMDEDEELLLNANDRQLMAQAIKTSKERMEFALEVERPNLPLPYDERYEEIGQGICIGDVPGATQRVFSMAKNPPPRMKKYWWKLFDEMQPAILDRLGKWDHKISEDKLPPIEDRSIRPLDDNGEPYPEDLSHFEPDLYASGYMPIPGIVHAMEHIVGRAMYEQYLLENGVDREQSDEFEPSTSDAS